jgi:PTS system nitrogen regulatory IIA component
MGHIASLLPSSNVVLDMPAANKRAVFEQVAALLEGKTGVKRGQILDSLLARERLGSTGLGQGIAIPHGRVRGLRDAVGAFLRTRTPIDFEAPDDLPVNLIFVLLVPEKSTDLHLEILSELAQIFSDREFRSQLAQASDAVAAQRLIVSWQSESPSLRPNATG